MNLTEFTPIIVISLFVLFSWLATLRAPTMDAQQYSSNRYEYLDGVRGLAAVIVVAAHIWRISPSAQTFSFSFSDRLNYGSFGVQIFFCITGFLFFGQMVSRGGKFVWDDFFMSRVRRIVPAYLVYYAFGVLIVLFLVDANKIHLKDLPNIIDMLFMGFAGNGTRMYFAGFELSYVFSVIWTLKFEALFYFMFPFVVFFFGRVGLKFGFAILLLLVFYELFESGKTFCGYFVIGGLAYYFLREVNLSWFFRIMGGVLALGVSVYVLSSSFPEYGIERYLLGAAVFFLIVACKPSLLSWRPLTYLGDISYSVYLVHLPILMIAKVIFIDVLLIREYTHISFFLMAAASVFFIFIIAALQYKYVERPFLRKPVSKEAGDGRLARAGQ